MLRPAMPLASSHLGDGSASGCAGHRFLTKRSVIVVVHVAYLDALLWVVVFLSFLFVAWTATALFICLSFLADACFLVLLVTRFLNTFSPSLHEAFLASIPSSEMVLR